MKKNDLNNRIARVFEEVATIIFNQLRGQYLAKFIPGGTAAEVAKQIEKSPVSVGWFTPEVWECLLSTGGRRSRRSNRQKGSSKL